MRIFKLLLLTLGLSLVCQSCGFYSFNGISIDSNIETFQVNFFQNEAAIVEPGIDRQFTFALQDLIQDQTNLSLVNNGGELLYEGEITEYRITPMTATADQRAAQNRLTISVMVRFSNKNKEDDDFERRFSFYHDYPANEQMTGSRLTTALDEIFTRITQDVFNESLAKW